jgi:hypothetical protein
MPIPACSGDTLSGGLATTATTTSNVGAYAITQGTLAASANYTLSYIGANLTATAARLAVTADTQGDAFPNYVTSNEFFGNGGNKNDNDFASRCTIEPVPSTIAISA